MKNIDFDDFDEIFKDIDFIDFTKEDEERFKQMEKEMLESEFFNSDIEFTEEEEEKFKQMEKEMLESDFFKDIDE